MKKVISYLLTPLSKVWEWGYSLRRTLYRWRVLKSFRVSVPVISIGNIAFGGTGKTPLVIWLAEYLNHHKKRVLVLTRGYKGKLENSSGVLRSEDRFKSDASHYGDEPLLISYKISEGAVVVGKKRYKNLVKYFKSVQPDVVLLDDGFQHLQLQRDLDIVLIDSTLPLSQFKTAPQGYLREGIGALNEAEVILFTRENQTTETQRSEIKKLLTDKIQNRPLWGGVQYQFEGFFDFSHTKQESDSTKGIDCIAVTGIANPQSFFNLLKEQGLNLKEEITFPDHYSFDDQRIEKILDKCTQENYYLLCTEKDMVKIRRRVNSNLLLYVKIGMNFSHGEEQLKQKIDHLCEISS